MAYCRKCRIYYREPIEEAGEHPCPRCKQGPGDEQECKHEWETDVDSIGHNEFQETVTCQKCGMPGERDRKTGEVFWPAT